MDAIEVFNFICSSSEKPPNENVIFMKAKKGDFMLISLSDGIALAFSLRILL